MVNGCIRDEMRDGGRLKAISDVLIKAEQFCVHDLSNAYVYHSRLL